MHRDIANRAGLLWGYDPAGISLAAQRENAVFHVNTDTGNYALRLHREGYRNHGQLISELQWMAAVEAGGISVPRPVPSLSGDLVHDVDGTLVDVLTWLPGRPIGARGILDRINDPIGLCNKLGAVMAKLHNVTDTWTPPQSFTRPVWDAEGLLGDTPVWGQFWIHPDLSSQDRNDLHAIRDIATHWFSKRQSELDYGLIHADVITENVMLDNDALSLIDFDDCGFGFRTFELATFLVRFLDKPNYGPIRKALVEGYSVRRQISDDELDFFLLLRSLTYLGWIIPRINEPGAKNRSRVALETALPLVRNYLANSR